MIAMLGTGLVLAAVLLQEPQPAVLVPGAAVRSEITDAAPVISSPGAARFTDAPVVGEVLRLEVQETGPYTIELRSPWFDTFLVLRDEQGEVLGEDDDGLFGTHSRLGAELQAGAAYLVEACALHGQRGAYEIRLLAGSPRPLGAEERRAATRADCRERQALLEGLADGPEKADALLSLADVLRSIQDVESAVAATERALAVRERILGPEHPELLPTLRRLYSLHLLRGTFRDALPDAERSLEIARKSLGPRHRDTLNCLDDVCSVLHELREDAAARQRLEAELPAFEALLDPEDLVVARAHNLLALALQSTGDLEAARPHYERCLAIREKVQEPEHQETALSLNNLGWLELRRRDLPAARALFERAIAIYEKANGCESRFGALALANLADTARAETDYRAARALLERSLAIRQRILPPGHPDTATNLHVLSDTCLALGEYERARTLCEQALAFREKAFGPDHAVTLETVRLLVTVQNMLGCYESARTLLERVRAVQERTLGPEDPEVATTLHQLGLLLGKQGLQQESREALLRAIAIREKVHGPEDWGTATTISDLAFSYFMTNDYAAARPLAERALRNLEKGLGPDNINTFIARNHLALILQELGEYAAARSLLEQSLASETRISGAEDLHASSVLASLSKQCRLEGDLPGARAFAERALSIHRRFVGSDSQGVVANLSALALIACDEGKPAEGAGHVTAALQSLRGLVSASFLGLTEGERLGLEHRHRDLLGMLLSMQADEEASAAAVIEWKSQGLRTLVAGQETERSLPPEVRAVRDRLRNLRSRLSDLGPPGTGADEEGRARKRTELSDQASALELELAGWWRRGGLELRPTSPEDLRRALPPGCVLLDFVVRRTWAADVFDGGRVKEPTRWKEAVVTAFVHRADRPKPARVELGPAGEIEREVQRFLEALHASGSARGIEIEAATAGARSEPGHRLFELLWQPLAHQVAGASLVLISPDGALGNLPFAALVDHDGRFLLESQRFALVPDAGMVVRIAERAPPTSTAMLASGGIDYGAAGAAPAVPTLVASRGTLAGKVWAELPGTRRELDRIAELWRGPPAELTRVEGAAATEDDLERTLTGKRWIHLATHGYFQPAELVAGQEPKGDGAPDEDLARAPIGLPPGLLSGLVCAGANLPQQEGRGNGLLTAAEIALLDLSDCELAFLSACETGLGTRRSGEGMLSVQRAFHAAGARAVVASLWNVGDAATADLVGRFYGNLWAGGASKLDALRDAQLALLAAARAAGDASGAPGSWAGFVLSGDWR